LLCEEGRILAVGPSGEVLAAAGGRRPELETDCGGQCLVPGLVDPHTHLCFAETREEEFVLRMQGTPYLEILSRGGGILSSVRAVRAASQADLEAATLGRLRSALSLGTTTVEIKSGYGLDTDSELKMLRAIHGAAGQTPQDIVATFMGGHAVPPEHRQDPEAYVSLLVEEMIPAVARTGLARFCDVFCEQGVFSPAQTRRILLAAREAGMGLKVHADEVHDLGGAALAAELGAVSAEHLLAAGDAGLQAMAAAGVMAVLLPGTALCLRKPYARARAMMDLGVPVALATDCNPGSCYCESMPLAFALAVLNMHMTVEEALVAATLNAAYAIGTAHRVGSLEPGKQADFLLLDGRSPAILAYHTGVSPVTAVYKRGERVA
jgi:imidazolonepropionase